MKKSLLSVVLVAALLFTTIFSVVGFQASAAEDINLLVEANTSVSGGDCTFEYVDGALVITSQGTSGDSIGIAGCGTYDAATYQYTKLTIDSEVPFVIAFYDGANSKWMTSTGDFYPSFNCATGGVSAAAGQYDLELWTNGCYTWDGSALPDTVQMTSIYIEPKAAGTLTVSQLALSDGEEEVEETTTTEAVEETTTTEAVEETTTTEAEEETTTTTGVVLDDAEVHYVVETKNVTEPIKAGDEVTLDVTLYGARNGLCTVQFFVSYDKTLLQATKSTKNDGALGSMEINKANRNPAQPLTENGEIWLTGMSIDEDNEWLYADIPDGQAIAHLVFTALQDITEDTEITVIGDVIALYLNPDDNSTVEYDAVGVNGGIKFPAAETTTTEAEETTTTTTAPTPATVGYEIETVEYTTENGVLAAGESVTVDVKLTGIDSIAMIEAIIGYDSDKLEISDATVGGVLANFEYHTINTAPVEPIGTAGEVWVTGMNVSNLAAEQDEVIATLTFIALTDIDEDVPVYFVQVPQAAVVDPENPLDLIDYEVVGVDGGIKLVEGTSTTTTTEAEVEETTTTTEAEVEETTTTTEAEVEETTTTTEAEVEETTTTAAADETTTAAADETTTAAADETTTVAGDTATTASTDGPKTGEESDAMLFILIAGMAAIAIVLSASVAKKVKTK